MADDVFPIMLGYDQRERIGEVRRAGLLLIVVGVPWAMIEPHEAQAKRNHGGQTLRRLAERGGLGAAEAVAVLCNGPYQQMPFAAAQARLSAMVIRYAAQTAQGEAEAEYRATGGF